MKAVSDNEVVRLLQSKLRELRKATPVVSPQNSKPIYVEQKRIQADGKAGLASCLIVMSSGCRWAKKSGGCSMCNFFIGTPFNRDCPDDVIITQLESLLAMHKPCGEVGLFTPGSFLEDTEISPGLRSELLHRVGKLPEVESVVIEGCVWDITEDKLSKARKCLPFNIALEIAIGLEAGEERVRRLCVNKPFKDSALYRASRKVKKIAKLRFYVLVKPPFLTEAEAIEDAVVAIRKAFLLECDTVVLQATNIKPYSLLEKLQLKNLYGPPKLWTILEILQRVEQENIRPPRLVVAGFEETQPAPTELAKNCALCTDRVMELLYRFNEGQTDVISTQILCDCRHAWLQEIKENLTREVDLAERVARQLCECFPEEVAQ